METTEWLILLGVFLVATVAVAGVGLSFGAGNSLRRRARELTAEETPITATGEVDADATGTLHRVAEPVARIALPDSPEEISRFRARFFNAGIRNRSAPTFFFALKAVLALGLPLLIWVVISLASTRASGNALLFMLVLGAALGYYAPNALLAHRIRARQQAIFESFPDAIDLMVVCIEAGLGIDQALQRVAREMALRSPTLSEEMTLVGVELRIGSSRERALLNFAARTGVAEIKMFVSMLLQADRFGTSVADSMRVHAQELRLRRQLRAEEAANKIPTKLLFPLMVTIFPALMVVLLGPAGLGLVRSLSKMTAG
jgi:tight adherence protein C